MSQHAYPLGPVPVWTVTVTVRHGPADEEQIALTQHVSASTQANAIAVALFSARLIQDEVPNKHALPADASVTILCHPYAPLPL
jgi:hypothetical protein